MVKDFLDGITSYGAAVRHLSKYGMWNYLVLPGILSVLTGIGIFGTAWGLSDNIGALLVNLWPWEWGSVVVGKAAQLFGGLLVLALGFMIFKQIIMVVTAPLMSILSERVENQVKGKPGSARLSLPQILSDILRGLRIAIRNLFRELFLTLVLLVFGLFPVFTPFTTVGIFVLQAYYAGFGNMDFTLERHFRYKDSVLFVQNNRLLAIGNGLVFILMLASFIGFLVAVPLSTVASTLETVKRIEASKTNP